MNLELLVKLEKIQGEVFKNAKNIKGVEKTHRVISTGYPEQFIRFSCEYCEVVFGNILWSIMNEWDSEQDDCEEEDIWGEYKSQTRGIINGEIYLFNVFHGEKRVTFID